MLFVKEKLSTKIFVIAVILLGTSICIWYLPPLKFIISVPALFFFMLEAFAEYLYIPLPRKNGTVSVGIAIIFAVYYIFGLEAAIFLAYFASFFAELDLDYVKKYFYRIFFNSSQVAISIFLASLVYKSLNGIPGQINLPADFAPIILASLVYWLSNMSFIMVVLFLSENITLFGIFKTNFKWAVPNYLSLTPLGVLIAISYLQVGVSGVVLLLLPLLIARYTFIQYIEMRETHLSTIKALTKAIEAKDVYTKGHSEWVARWVVEIAKEMNFSEDEIEKLEYLALMHDVGKIGISEGILNKPDRLTDEEFAVIRRHSEMGAEIISEIKYFGADADVVRYHHTWYNGKGYPQADPEDIPLGARIVAVADAFDAMTRKRVYREAVSFAEARQELLSCSGSQFDPKIVQAFLKVLKRHPEWEQEKGDDK